MNWRSHRVTDRAHSFVRSQVVSDCGSARGIDCAQFVIGGAPNESIPQIIGPVVYIPPNACRQCARCTKKRVRLRFKAAQRTPDRFGEVRAG